MRDVVIIGGGLSGLSAACELESLKIPYRLIEVKKRLGGSIMSYRQDGFVLEGGSFAFSAVGDWSFLPDYGFENALCDVRDGHERSYMSSFAHTRSQWVAFKEGTQALTDALAKKLTGTFLHRMAVSSLGELDGRYTICMENGLMLDAAAIIIAAPARHAERMLRTLQPEVAQRLFTYGYDTITYLAMGYRREDVPLPPSLPWDMAVPYFWWTDDPNRVPEGHILLQTGIRTPLNLAASDKLIHTIHEEVKATGQPVMTHLDYWPEADPLPPHSRDFSTRMAELHAMLPPGIALAGNDYNGITLANRIAGGKAAARKIAMLFKVE